MVPENSVKHKKNFTQKLSLLLRSGAFSFFLLILCLFVFSWSFLAHIAGYPLFFPFIFYFSAWLALIFILFTINSFSEEEDEESND
jgi:hypothetical protein